MGDKGLNSAIENIERALQDTDALDAYLTRKIEERRIEIRMNEREEKGIKKGIKEGIKEGIKKGKIEGKEEEKIETATKLKNMGLSIEDIVKATDLDPELIEKL